MNDVVKREGCTKTESLATSWAEKIVNKEREKIRDNSKEKEGVYSLSKATTKNNNESSNVVWPFFIWKEAFE